MRLLAESGVSANNPLFPRFVRSALDPGNQILLEVLSEERIDQVTAKDLLRKAKAVGDAIDAEREARKGRLSEAGFEEPDEEQRRKNLAANVGLLEWPGGRTRSQQQPHGLGRCQTHRRERFRRLPFLLGASRLRQLSLSSRSSQPRFTLAAPRFRPCLRRFFSFVFGYPAHRVLPREDKGGQNALVR